MNSNILVHIMPAKNIPVFCLFSVYENDCVLDDSGKYHFKLSKEKQDTIIKHFPNADSVAIISDPAMFIEEVVNSIGCYVKHEKVHYFHIDKGMGITNDGNRTMEMEYMQYLMQDTPPFTDEKGNKHYVFHADYAFRVLFCKDVFFTNEQEYRIVLPNERINEGTHYPVKISEDIKIAPIEILLHS